LHYLFEDHALDTDRRELRRNRELVAVEPQVFDLIEYLIRNRTRVVSRDELLSAVWKGRIVSESALTTRLNGARVALGDSGEEQRLIKTLPRKGFRFVGNIDERGMPVAPERSRAQQISFCRTEDGYNIAMARVGEGSTLVRATTWLNHLEYEWDDPIRGPLLRFLAGRHDFVRYDGRGNGLSDRGVDELSITTFERDLDAVVGAMKLQRYAIFGISQGGPTAIAHAVRYPERVTKLVIYGSYARGRNKRISAKEKEVAQAYLTLMRHGWGDENSAFIRTFSRMFAPNASAEQIKAFATLQRLATSPQNAVRLRSAVDDLDVDDLLPRVSVPTLVIHARHDQTSPFDEGRRLAAGIPNARFVSLESENHMPTPDDPEWEKFTGEIESFLAS
jgi:pimeloyl-ACP methyl ester carboxylesterase